MTRRRDPLLTVPGMRWRATPGRVLTATVLLLTLFEVTHRGLRLPQMASAVILSAILFPLLVWGIVSTIRAIIADPAAHGHTLAHLFASLGLLIVFFAVVYSELGILATARPGVEVTDPWTCLYFSATTITTLGFGDYAPTPEARVVAAIEGLTGYVLLGMVTAAAFAVIHHHSRPPREEPAPAPEPSLPTAET